MSVASQEKPFIEIKESRLMSFVVAIFALVLGLCAPFVVGPLVGTIVALSGIYYSCVHWRRFFSADRVTLRVDEAGLSGTMVGSDGVIPWAEVAGCSAASTSNDYSIRLKNGKIINLSEMELPPFSTGLKEYVDRHLTQIP